jgi:hypothetical protein
MGARDLSFCRIGGTSVDQFTSSIICAFHCLKTPRHGILENKLRYTLAAANPDTVPVQSLRTILELATQAGVIVIGVR